MLQREVYNLGEGVGKHRWKRVVRANGPKITILLPLLEDLYFALSEPSLISIDPSLRDRSYSFNIHLSWAINRRKPNPLVVVLDERKSSRTSWL